MYWFSVLNRHLDVCKTLYYDTSKTALTLPTNRLLVYSVEGFVSILNNVFTSALTSIFRCYVRAI